MAISTKHLPQMYNRYSERRNIELYFAQAAPCTQLQVNLSESPIQTVNCTTMLVLLSRQFINTYVSIREVVFRLSRKYLGGLK